MTDVKTALQAQRNEITGHYIYKGLATGETGKNKKILLEIAKDELKHYEFWKNITTKEVKPRFVRWYIFLAHTFGIVFLLKILEQQDQQTYSTLSTKGIEAIIKDEEKHEMLLLSQYKEERLEYASSVVLGLNDAIVELTGVLAGLTIALPSSTLIAIAGFVTGVAASMSMAASAYFAAKEEAGAKHPVKVAMYTGITYLVIVLLLVAPYVLLTNPYISLGIALSLAIVIIAAYTAYIAIAKELGFWRRFLEMALVSISVAAISFVLGWVLNQWFGITA